MKNLGYKLTKPPMKLGFTEQLTITEDNSPLAIITITTMNQFATHEFMRYTFFSQEMSEALEKAVDGNIEPAKDLLKRIGNWK